MKISFFLLGLIFFSNSWAKPLKKEFILKGVKLSGIYKSMEGPMETLMDIDFGAKDSKFIWITMMKVEVLDSNHKVDSQEFLCHAVFNYPDEDNPHSSLGIAQGIKTIKFPKGLALRVPNKQKNTFIQAQALNNNYPKINKTIHFKFSFEYYDEKTAKKLGLRPLHMKFLGSLCPFKRNRFSPGCEPVYKENHHLSPSGKKMTDHWWVPPGRHEYVSIQEGDLAIKKNMKVHYVWMHLHPYGESIELRKVGAKTPLWKGKAQNNPNKAILEKVDTYSSKNGFNLYQGQQYELVTIYDNPQQKNIDAMGLLFMYYTPIKGTN